MFVCVLNRDRETLLHRNTPAGRTDLEQVDRRFPGDLVIAVECIFTWCWIADFWDGRDAPFVLGHAPYMEAIHGGKSKNDRIDSEKIASLLRAGTLPMARVYSREICGTRDLLRRREYFMHQQPELLTHVQNTNTPCNYPSFAKRIAAASNRTGLQQRFEEPSARKSVEADLHLLDIYHRVQLAVESEIRRQAKHQGPVACHLLRTIPGVWPILALLIP